MGFKQQINCIEGGERERDRYIYIYIPDAPCMEYLPTLTSKTSLFYLHWPQKHHYNQTTWKQGIWWWIRLENEFWKNWELDFKKHKFEFDSLPMETFIGATKVLNSNLILYRQSTTSTCTTSTTSTTRTTNTTLLPLVVPQLQLLLALLLLLLLLLLSSSTT